MPSPSQSSTRVCSSSGMSYAYSSSLSNPAFQLDRCPMHIRLHYRIPSLHLPRFTINIHRHHQPPTHISMHQTHRHRNPSFQLPPSPLSPQCPISLHSHCHDPWYTITLLIVDQGMFQLRGMSHAYPSLLSRYAIESHPYTSPDPPSAYTATTNR